MQLALAAGSTERGTVSTARATGLLAAGVALAGAGVIAVNPIAPMISAAAQQPAVQLTATTAENFDHIIDLLTGPSPVFTALGELGSYYGDTTANSFQGVLDGLEIMWSGGGRVIGLETLLPQVAEYLGQGDFLNAWNLINNDMLYNMNNIFQPLFDHTPRGTTEEVPGVMGIGADMTRVFAAMQEIFDFDFWKTTAKYFFEPFTGFVFSLSENLTGLPDGVEHELQSPIDALLNGYITWDSETGEDTGQWWGLLTENGSISYFLDFLPNQIADALTSTIPVADVDVPDTSVADPSLLDFGWLDSLFN